MFISSFRVENYKSFLSSKNLVLSPSLNIIVGQNNAGKTALAEALSLNFIDIPHRTIKTVPKRDYPYERISKCYLTYKFAEYEAEILLNKISQYKVPKKDRVSSEESKRSFRNVLILGGTLECTFQQRQFISAYFSEYGKYDDYGKAIIFDNNVTNSSSFSNTETVMLINFNYDKDYGVYLANELRSRIYMFKAERLNVEECRLKNERILKPDASNLPDVLHFLLTSNPSRFQRFNQFVSTIFPDIKQITVTTQDSSKVKIVIWPIDPGTEREDLAVPLSESGTGIGQVLAILYIILTSDEPRTIIIDEPQSFLHPGAIRKLIEILKLEQHRKHQYIITTHSPTVVTAINPETIFLVRKQACESTVEAISTSEANDLQTFLLDIGARLSDVFGTDNILWVEGATEEKCFNEILNNPKLKKEIVGEEILVTQVIGVQNTGDILGRHSKTVFNIYTRLSSGAALLPPAIGFIFDREDRSEKEREDLDRQSKGKVLFLKRKMYENYLLNPNAISTVLSEADISGKTAIAPAQIEDWLQSNSQNKKYIKHAIPFDDPQWRVKVDGANLLKDIFIEFSENRVEYDKVKHGVHLTKWIIKNIPSDLDDVVEVMKKVFGKKAGFTGN